MAAGNQATLGGEWSSENAVAILLITILLTALIAVIEIVNESKASPRAIVSPVFGMYFAILAVGNCFPALVAPLVIRDAVAVDLGHLWPFFYAFAGVFAFRGILSNTNITVFDQNVLTIQDWIAKARTPAIAAAIKNQILREKEDAQQLANDLTKIAESKLAVVLEQTLGKAALDELQGPESHFKKALKLATERPDDARALLKAEKSP
ncbi:MAG: hypothetical protein O2968_21740 [Acidobacteria bacterium]|nr:hypothetical protein [Acidobacteriota bacterium]